MAFGDFGEWLGSLQFRQRRVDPGLCLLLTLNFVHVFDDVRGLKHLRVAEVFAVRLIESFDFPRRRLGRSGHHLRMRALQAELPLNRLPQEAVVERRAAIAGLLLPLHLLLDRLRIDGPRIPGRGLLHQHSVDSRMLRGDPQLPLPLGFICDGVKPQVVAQALLFLADPLFRHWLPVDEIWHSYLLVLTSTMTPPEVSGATRSGLPAVAGWPCRFSARIPPGLGPAPI